MSKLSVLSVALLFFIVGCSKPAPPTLSGVFLYQEKDTRFSNGYHKYDFRTDGSVITEDESTVLGFKFLGAGKGTYTVHGSNVQATLSVTVKGPKEDDAFQIVELFRIDGQDLIHVSSTRSPKWEVQQDEQQTRYSLKR